MKRFFSFAKLISAIALLSVSVATAYAAPTPVKPMSEHRSDYVPKIFNKMPVIKIQSDSGSSDFVTKPLSLSVKKHMLTWGEENSSPTPWYEKCTVSVIDGNGAVTVDTAAAQVKVRGNWTTSYEKKPLRIKFSEKQEMLGLNGGRKFKNWVLLAMYKDWSMLRDASALYMSKLISSDYSSDCTFVEVYINSEYWGVYLLAEQQEAKRGRVSIAEPEKNYKKSDIGYFIEFDGYFFAEENNFWIDYLGEIKDIKGVPITAALNRGYTIKSDITSPSQKTFISSYMNNLWKICYEAAYNKKFYKFTDDYTDIMPDRKCKNSYECISNIIDIESLVNTYVLSEITCDPDLYWSSFMMDIDFSNNGNKMLKFEAPWDFDSTMGNKNFCLDGKGVYAGAVSWDGDHKQKGTGNPWMFIFVKCDWFQTLVRQKWAAIHNQDVMTRTLYFIDCAQQAYSKNFIENTKRWENIGPNKDGAHELSQKALACKNQAEASRFLKKWISTRFSELDKIYLK